MRISTFQTVRQCLIERRGVVDASGRCLSSFSTVNRRVVYETIKCHPQRAISTARYQTSTLKKSLSSPMNARSMLFSSYPPHLVVGMPALSPTMTSGTIGKWQCKIGDAVKPGDAYAEVETDKASMAWEVQEEAYIAQILVPNGTEVTVGAPVLVTVDDAGLVPAFANFSIEKPVSKPAEAVPALAPAQSVSAPIVLPPVTPPVAPAAAVASSPKIDDSKKISKEVSTKSTKVAAPKHFVWGSNGAKSTLSHKLSKEQATYNEKYGRSLHKPIEA